MLSNLLLIRYSKTAIYLFWTVPCCSKSKFSKSDSKSIYNVNVFSPAVWITFIISTLAWFRILTFSDNMNSEKFDITEGRYCAAIYPDISFILIKHYLMHCKYACWAFISVGYICNSYFNNFSLWSAPILDSNIFSNAKNTYVWSSVSVSLMHSIMRYRESANTLYGMHLLIFANS